MSNGQWDLVALGEVVTEDREKVRVESHDAYPVAGLLIAGEGLFWRETMLGTATKYEHLYRLRAGQLVYRKLTAWEGPITVVSPEFDGAFVSAEFPTFTLDQSRLLPRFMSLLCQQPSFHEEMRMRSTGTAERRSRLNPGDLLEIEIELPPIDEQKRIVDHCEAIQLLARRCARAETAATDLTRALRERLFAGIEDSEGLSQVVTAIDSGESPKCLTRPPAAGEWGVLKTSSVRPGEFRPAEAKALPATAEPKVRSEVKPGDVLAIRASGSRRLVGAVCRIEDTPDRLLMSDYHWRLQLSDEVDPDYFVEAMSLAESRLQVEDLTTGSTTAGKISQASLMEVEIPLVRDKAAQRRIVASLRAASAAARAHRREKDAALALWRSTAEDLLAGEIAVS